MLKAKIANIYYAKDKEKIWFVDCVAFNNTEFSEQYNKIFLKYENVLPRINDIVIIYEDISIRKMLAMPINDFQDKIKSGEGIIGQVWNDNYLLFSSGNITNSTNTNNIALSSNNTTFNTQDTFNIDSKNKAIIKATNKVNLNTATVNISQNISDERTQDQIRVDEIITVLNALTTVTQLEVIEPIILSAIATITASQASSATLKNAFDTTFDT